MPYRVEDRYSPAVHFEGRSLAMPGLFSVAMLWDLAVKHGCFGQVGSGLLKRWDIVPGSCCRIRPRFWFNE
jgi:hypothetical protein